MNLKLEDYLNFIFHEESVEIKDGILDTTLFTLPNKLFNEYDIDNEIEEDVLKRVIELKKDELTQLLSKHENVVNPLDRNYYNNKYSISLDFGRNKYIVFAQSESNCLEILVGYFVNNSIHLIDLIPFDEIEKDTEDDYIYIDCSEYISSDKNNQYYIDSIGLTIESL